jgi:hypothetical protein
MTGRLQRLITLAAVIDLVLLEDGGRSWLLGDDVADRRPQGDDHAPVPLGLVV